MLNHYINFVKPAYEEFCMPTKKFADVIIPRGADNKIAIELISHHITDLLTNPPSQRRYVYGNTQPARTTSGNLGSRLPPNFALDVKMKVER